ncbi:VOC family protein [Streptomyces sp. NPDC058001]|uniref:VOC family protein n=1 Tax=Streptomyces sp. NPDC058001 TaxID=3346300 RepID=UPI0036F129B6
MKATDQFHVGVVVDDFEATSDELAEVFGYTWCEEIGGPTAVTLPTGDTVLDFRSTYSMSTPRLEIIQSIPGTVWTPAAGSGVHHLGYWSDDVAAESAALARRGHTVEAIGRRPDGTPYWAYHRAGSGPRIELVTRALQPNLEQYWANGRKPS